MLKLVLWSFSYFIAIIYLCIFIVNIYSVFLFCLQLLCDKQCLSYNASLLNEWGRFGLQNNFIWQFYFSSFLYFLFPFWFLSLFLSFFPFSSPLLSLSLPSPFLPSSLSSFLLFFPFPYIFSTRHSKIHILIIK